MPRFLLLTLIVFTFAVPVTAQTGGPAAPQYGEGQPLAPFDVTPHDDVTIEWWYLNANLHTASGRHLALIGSFFRFGNTRGQAAKDSRLKVHQSSYLIYAITDIDQKKHYTYSYGDRNTLALLQQAAAIGLEEYPESPRLQALVTTLNQGQFPPPTRLITGQCTISSSPFSAQYGRDNSVTSVLGALDGFKLSLGAGSKNANATITFSALKTPMLVNGDGNTGLRVRTDMKYISLTRNSVSGTIDTGSGPEQATGEGWFDHQWGNSWTTQSAGWDWWGVQLGNGTDILFFQQIDLKTGKTFFPCATFEDADGKQLTTHNIAFSYDPASLWKSPRTGSRYPMDWTVSFPDQHLTLKITPDMQDQEMPVLAAGGAIWEGSCGVAANLDGLQIPGVAYMELVGYNSAVVRATLASTGAQ